MANYQAGVRVEGADVLLRALQPYMPKEMQQASKRATTAGARVAAKLIKLGTPTKTRKLQRSVRTRRISVGYAAAGASPSAKHRHLVIRGHRIVTPGGRDTGQMSRANPFVDRTTDAGRFLIVEAVKRELYQK